MNGFKDSRRAVLDSRAMDEILKQQERAASVNTRRGFLASIAAAVVGVWGIRKFSRPYLTINRIPGFTKRIVDQMRLQRPSESKLHWQYRTGTMKRHNLADFLT